MTPDEFRDLVAEMRTAQRSYFAYRAQDDLREAKRLESAVDAALAGRDNRGSDGLFPINSLGHPDLHSRRSRSPRRR